MELLRFRHLRSNTATVVRLIRSTLNPSLLLHRPFLLRTRSSTPGQYLLSRVLFSQWESSGGSGDNKSRSDPISEPEWQSSFRHQLDETIDIAERQNYREFFARGSRLVIGLLEHVHEIQLKGKSVDELADWIRRQEMADEHSNLIIEFLRRRVRVLNLLPDA